MRAYAPTIIVFLAFWLFFLVAGQSKLLRDPGTLWHPVVGQLIIDDGLIHCDPFSFTFRGSPWIPHQWLGEILMAVIVKAAGLDGLVLVAATMLAAIFTVLALRLYRTGLNFAATAVVMGLALAAATMHLHVRPMLMTTIALPITLIALTDCESRLHWRRLLLLIPLFAFWANLHGGMLGGWLMLGLAIGGWTLWKLAGWPSPLQSTKQFVLLGLLFVACGLTMFANPYGFGLPRVWFAISSQSKLSEIIEEHKPLDPADAGAWPLFALMAVYLLVLGGLTAKPRATWLLPLFWLVQAILHVRHAPLFALTALVAIAAAWPHTRWAAWLSAKRPDWYDPKANRDIHFVWWVPLGLSAISAALILGEIRVPVIGAGWAKLDAERWPVELEADLRQSIAKDPQARYFNDCEFGGFLIHCGSRGVFVDDRAELYGSEFLEAFANADPATAMPAWQAKYGKFQFALVRPDGSFYDWFAGQGWIVKGRCRAAVWYQAPMIANDSQ